MRTAHYLRDNLNSEMPSQAVWFDTETQPEKLNENTIRHHLWFGWAAYARRLRSDRWSNPQWLRFTSAPELWTWIDARTRPGTKLFCFCHNTNFDLPVLDTFANLPALGWALKQACIDAPPTILNFRRGKRTLCILDTLNLWRMPLKQLGEMVGTSKLAMPKPDALSDEWDRYARQDVQVILDACLQWWRFLRENDMGGFAPTLAGQALRSYRHRFMPAKILIDDNADALALARSSYLGGRCECFRLGAVVGPITCLDINSMYPSVMRANTFPARLLGVTHARSSYAIDKYRVTHCLIADVSLDTDEPVYPKIVDKRLCFPVGRFRAVLAGPELLHALDHGAVSRVHATAVYHGADLFTAFVDELHGRRLEFQAAGNVQAAWLYKILLNSLYGKFGQRGLIWESLGQVPDLSARVWTEVSFETGERDEYRQLGGLVQKLAGESEGRDSSPAVASYVTSYARLALWELIEEAGREHVHYVDTDSLFVDPAGLQALSSRLHPTRLGALKVECEAPDAAIYGPKDYRLGTKERHKGVRAAARWTGPATLMQEQWSSLRGGARRGDLSLATTARVGKTLSRHYLKGTVGENGRVSPFVLNEGDAPE